MSLIEPVLAEPASPEDFARQAAERVTPFGQALGEAVLGGLEGTRPATAVRLLTQPPRQERNESLMLPGAPDEFGRASPVDTGGLPTPAPISPVLTKDQFDGSIYKRPGLEWEPGLTEARADARSADHDRDAWRASLLDRYQGGYLGQAAIFGAGLATGATDFTNYIPLLGPAQRALMLARFGRVGGSLLMHGADAALNTGMFEPLTAASAQAEGRSYGWVEAGADILKNALGGAVLGTAVGEAARLFGFGHGERPSVDGTGPVSPLDDKAPLAPGEAEPPPTITEPGAALTPAEEDALRSYKDLGYLNQRFRAEGKLAPVDTPKAEAQAATLDAALAKSRVAQDTTVYRGIATGEKAGDPAAMVGKELPASNFQSATTDRELGLQYAGRDQDGGGGVLLEVNVPAGSRGAWLDQYAKEGRPAENELLLPRDGSFRVTAARREGNVTVLTGEWLDPKAPGRAAPPEVGAGVAPRRAGQAPLRVDDLMRRADAANLAAAQIEAGEPVDVGKVLANDPAVRASAAEPAPSPRRQAAGEDVAITSAGRRVPVAYEVVEAHTLVASHTEDMRVNPAFPAELQPRDRTRAASGTQVAAMASNLEPALLGRSATASEGAPIVGPDGVVESGNARVLAIRKAYGEGLPGSTAYRDFLVASGHPEAAGMEAPVLVRRRTGAMTPDERAAFAREANVSGVAQMGTAERAASDAAALKPGHLELLASADLHAAANRPFVRAFLGTLPEGERAGLLTAGGELSKAGGERVRNAVLAKAFGDVGLVARLAEEPESGLNGLGQALAGVAPEWAKMRAEVAAGQIAPEGDGTAALLEALHAIIAAKAAGNPPHFALEQGDMLGGGLSRDGAAFLRAFLVLDRKGGSRVLGREKLAALLDRYVTEARKQPPGVDMFGNRPATPAEILEGRTAPTGPARVGDEVGRQLAAAGVPEAEARPQAALWQSFFATMGRRAGIDPGALFDRYRVGVERGGKAEAGALFQIKAFHGSPHVFDEFSLKHIGSGEGAQAYGHGLYFAENEEVAAGYKHNLTRTKGEWEWQGQPLRESRDWYSAIDAAEKKNWRVAKILDQAGKTGIDSARDAYSVRNYSGPEWDEARKQFESGVKFIPNKGALYQVHLDVDHADLLDWDKPLSGQSPKVREKLAAAGVTDQTHGSLKVYEHPAGGRFQVMDPATGGFAGFKTREEAQAAASRAAPRGEEIYNSLSRGNQAAASEALRQAGVPGIRYLDAGSRSDGDGTRNIVLFDDSKVKITRRNGEALTPKEREQALYQMRREQAGEPATARGSISFAHDGQTVIRLFQHADASTFLHESGHLFARVMRDLAEKEGAPEGIARDWRTLRDWLGVKEGEGLGVEHEEKLARGFEAYLRDGEAPTPALRGVFETIKGWLRNVYKSLTELGVEPSPEVRAVFDRMLGGEEDAGRREPMSLATAAPEPPHPSVAEAAKRVGKGGDELATLKEDAKLEGYDKPLPGHEPKPEPGAEPAKPKPEPTPREKAAALADLPPELADVEALRRAGELPEGADAILADAEREAQTREAWGDAYGILLGCVMRTV